MTPPVVIFDLGGVFLDFDYGIAAQKIADRSDATPAQVRELIDHSPLLRRYESAQITTAEFFAEVCAATKFRGTLEEFGDAFNSIFTLIEPMLDIHLAVRRQGSATVVLSNTSELAIGHIKRTWQFLDNFDARVFSHEVGAMKPDEKIYAAAEKACRRYGEGVVFIDDRADNIAAARARDWRTILHESPEKTRARLDALELLK